MAFRKDYGAVDSGLRLLSSGMGEGERLRLSEVSPEVSLIVSRDEIARKPLGGNAVSGQNDVEVQDILYHRAIRLPSSISCPRWRPW